MCMVSDALDASEILIWATGGLKTLPRNITKLTNSVDTDTNTDTSSLPALIPPILVPILGIGHSLPDCHKVWLMTMVTIIFR